MGPDPGVSFSPICKAFDRDSFDCGNQVLNEYLSTVALRHQLQGYNRTFIMHSEGASRVLGYFSLCSAISSYGSFPPEFLKRYPKAGPLPCTLLTKLAIDRSLQGRGLGHYLMHQALCTALHSSYLVASVMLLVDAIDEPAKRFYEHFGMVSLVGNPMRLFLPMKTIEEASMTSPKSRYDLHI